MDFSDSQYGPRLVSGNVSREPSLRIVTAAIVPKSGPVTRKRGGVPRSKMESEISPLGVAIAFVSAPCGALTVPCACSRP